jgi:hypothetical protein
MKTFKARISLFLIMLLGLAVAGCFPEKKIVWSPDGETAAVMAGKTLYFCDVSGRLSSPQMSNVVAVAWLPNSKDLIAEIHLTAKTWPEFISLAGEAKAKEVMEKARVLTSRLSERVKSQDLLEEINQQLGDNYAEAIRLYWRDSGPDKMPDLSPQEEVELQKERAAEVVFLRRMKFEEGRLTKERELGCGIEPAMELRVSPKGDLLAYATRSGLRVIPVDGSEPAALVESNSVAWFFDWTSDGTALVYIKNPHAKSKSEVNLGVLVRRRILTDNGSIEPADEGEDLAGVLFDEFSKVRCLKDGRILFASMPLQLPATGMEMPQREQLFALDPARYHSAIRLIPNAAEEQMPKRMANFELSPNEKNLSVMFDNGGVAVFHLDTGTVDVVQADGDSSKGQLIPIWRTGDELCFVSFAEKGKTNQERTVEIALWQNGKTRLISSQWPSNIVAKMIETEDVKPSPRNKKERKRN